MFDLGCPFRAHLSISTISSVGRAECPAAGTWVQTTQIVYATEVCSGQGEDYSDSDVSITLSSNGVATISFEGDAEDSASWTQSGNQVSISDGGGEEALTFTISGNTLTFQGVMDGSCMYIVLTKI